MAEIKIYGKLKAYTEEGKVADASDISGLSPIATEGLTSAAIIAALGYTPGTSNFSGAYADLSGKPNLATVATSGSYNDLSNKPSNVSTFTNDAGYLTSQALTDYATKSYVNNKSYLVTEGDNRTVSTKPNDYENTFVFKGLKTNTYIDSPSSDIYSYLFGLRGWSDSSGGNSHEIAFNNSGIYIRNGATTSWGSWNKVATQTWVQQQGYVTTDHTYNFSGTTFVSGNSDTGEHNANNITYNGHFYYTSNGPSGIGNTTTDGALYSQAYNSDWVAQIAQDYRNGNLFVRGKNNGSWQAWKRIARTEEVCISRVGENSNYSEIGTSFIGGTAGGPRTSNWEYLYRAQHRNGAGDGGSYIMEIVSNLTSDSSIYWRKKIGGDFLGWRTIIDDSNIDSYAITSLDSCAKLREHNDLTASGNEFTFASSGFVGTIYFNYRTAGGTNGDITEYVFGNGKGGSLGTAIHTGNISSYAFVNAGSSPNLNDGTTVTQPGGDNAISIKTPGSVHDTGIFRMSQDNAYICNSSDDNYSFAVFDTDLTTNFSSVNDASFVVQSDGKGCKIRGSRVLHASNSFWDIDNSELFVNAVSGAEFVIYNITNATLSVKCYSSSGTLMRTKNLSGSGFMIRFLPWEITIRSFNNTSFTDGLTLSNYRRIGFYCPNDNHAIVTNITPDSTIDLNPSYSR